MKFRQLAFLAACVGALSAPAYAETHITVLHVSDNAATVRQIQTNASTSAISPILPINTYLFTALRPDTLAMG